jgi:hypothetical protein
MPLLKCIAPVAQSIFMQRLHCRCVCEQVTDMIGWAARSQEEHPPSVRAPATLSRTWARRFRDKQRRRHSRSTRSRRRHTRDGKLNHLIANIAGLGRRSIGFKDGSCNLWHETRWTRVRCVGATPTGSCSWIMWSRGCGFAGRRQSAAAMEWGGRRAVKALPAPAKHDHGSQTEPSVRRTEEFLRPQRCSLAWSAPVR